MWRGFAAIATEGKGAHVRMPIRMVDSDAQPAKLTP
jgi:hypothetical protein